MPTEKAHTTARGSSHHPTATLHRPNNTSEPRLKTAKLEEDQRQQEQERRRREDERCRQQEEQERRRQEEQRRREQEELRRQERLERERRIQQEIDRENEECKQKLSNAKEKLKQKQNFKGQERHHQRTHVLHQLVEDDATAIERDEPVDVEEMFKDLLSKYSIDEDEIMTTLSALDKDDPVKHLEERGTDELKDVETILDEMRESNYPENILLALEEVLKHLEIELPKYALIDLSEQDIKDVKQKIKGPVENYEVEVQHAYSQEIVFGTVGTFAADILKQEFERSPTRGSRDFELVIVDEVDYMTLDNGVQIKAKVIPYTRESQSYVGMFKKSLKSLRRKRQRTNKGDVDRNSPVNADHVPPKSAFQKARRILEENSQESQNLKEKNPKLYEIIQNARNDARGDNLLAMEVLTSHHRQALTTGNYLESQRCRELVCNSAVSGDGEKMIKLSLILAHPMTSQNLREDAGIQRQRLNHSLSEDATKGYYKIGNLEIVKQYCKLGVIDQNQRDRLLSWVQEDGYLNHETSEYKECLDTCKSAKAEAEAEAAMAK
ncbi:trichohyalin-like [Engraulis encrasicolus]|uniref:trichohyalin-like n=1 Tax=Engraulis encrasicolus TaxID=184585 RepID=UPI002FCE92E1